MEVENKLFFPEGRWRDIDKIFLRQGNIVGEGFEPCSEVELFVFF